MLLSVPLLALLMGCLNSPAVSAASPQASAASPQVSAASPQASAGVAPAAPAPSRIIYVVDHGWHAGIVVGRADVPASALPPLPGLPDSRYLEIGWGDRDFYRAPAPGPGLILKAALWPTASVLHVAAFSDPVVAYFPASRITRLELSQAGFEALLQRVSRSFERDADGASRPLGAGLYGASQFYLSRESYHLLRTCNVWTAQVLQAGGLPIRPMRTLTTDRLFERIRGHGEVLRDPGPVDSRMGAGAPVS